MRAAHPELTAYRAGPAAEHLVNVADRPSRAWRAAVAAVWEAKGGEAAAATPAAAAFLAAYTLTAFVFNKLCLDGRVARGVYRVVPDDPAPPSPAAAVTPAADAPLPFVWHVSADTWVVARAALVRYVQSVYPELSAYTAADAVARRSDMTVRAYPDFLTADTTAARGWRHTRDVIRAARGAPAAAAVPNPTYHLLEQLCAEGRIPAGTYRVVE